MFSARPRVWIRLTGLSQKRVSPTVHSWRRLRATEDLSTDTHILTISPITQTKVSVDLQVLESAVTHVISRMSHNKLFALTDGFQSTHACYESVFRFRVMVFDGVITFRGVIGAEGYNFCILMGGGN